MNFNSPEFIFIFFIAIISIYYLSPRQFRIPVLFLSSIFFYGFSGDMAAAMLLLTIAWAAVFGLVLERGRNIWLLGVAVSFPLAILFLFKYLDFTISAVDPGGESRDFFAPILKYSLPAGISFYTFQIVGYLIDVRDGKISADRKFIIFSSFATFFPQLIAGPILRFHELRDQLINISENQKINFDFRRGIKYLSFGLAYKIFCADILRHFQESYTITADSGSLDALYSVLSYSFIIYFDFWAYSLMAIGIAKLFGIEIPRNFREPYLAFSPKEFWRRWHITLSLWLRDYLYFRIGGNKHYVRNIAIVFIACGIWHGAGWNFIVWGAYHAILVIAYHYGRTYWDKLPHVVGVGLTFILVTLGWPLFYLELGPFVELITILFSGREAISGAQFGILHWAYVGIVSALVFVAREDNWLFNEKPMVIVDSPIFQGAVFSISVIFFQYGMTFIYFRF
jgi:alginate O-acetyltransferase complex protein AlgI